MEEKGPLKTSRDAAFFQFIAGISVGFSAMATGAWIAWPSAANKPLFLGKIGFNVSSSQISIMVAAMDFANVLTPIPTSYLMNWIGRKGTLGSTAILFLLASIFCIWAQNIYYIYAARILAGLAKGITFTVVPIFLAEIANVHIRGALSTMFTGFLNIGSFYVYVLATFITYDQLNFANFIIPIAFIITFIFVPESPYYLVKNKQIDVAKENLARYRRVKPENENLLYEMDLIKLTVEKDMQNKARFRDVIGTAANRRALLIITVLAWFQRSSGISPTLAYSTITLPETGGGASREVYMIIFSFILILANFFATPLIDYMGRKPLLIISAVSTVVVQALTGLFYCLDNNGIEVSSYSWIPYVCLVMFAVTYSLGIGFIPSTFVGELFPTNVKTYAGSISAIILAATSFGVNRVFREVADSIGVEYMYLYFTICSSFCAIYVSFFIFETKGKTFLEIQNELQTN